MNFTSLLFLVLVFVQCSRGELENANAEEGDKKVNPYPYDQLLMDDSRAQNTYHGFKLRRAAERRLSTTLRHRGNREEEIQAEEDYLLDFIQQCNVARRRRIADDKVLKAKELRSFLRKYRIRLNVHHIRRRTKRVIQGTEGTADMLRWNKCIIPYDMSSIEQSDYIGRVQAMNKYHYWTSFKFIPLKRVNLADLGHTNFLKHVKYPSTHKKAGCWSFVGNIRAKQGQEIACCGGITCQHELGHAIGAHHTQKSPNRNLYLRVNYDYISEGWRSQYHKLSQYSVQYYDHYDYGSIMHYGSYTAANEGLKTMIPYNLIHQNELINKDLNSFYLFKEMDKAYGCAVTNCPDFDMTCENDGYLAEIGFDNKCKCRCCDGLDPETGCTTIYHGGKEKVSWPYGSYTLLQPVQSGCPMGFKSGSVIQFLQWRETDKSEPFHYNAKKGDNYIQHRFCSASKTSRAYFPPGKYCLLRSRGRCPRGFQYGYIQFKDNRAPLKSGKLPYGLYGSDVRLYFCCREDGNLRDPMILPTNEPLILFQMSRDGCQHVEDMYSESEYFRVNYNSKRNKHVVAGSVPYITFPERKTRLEIKYCYYTKLNYGCGKVINLSKSSPSAVIRTPNYPLPYNNLQRCTWLIKSPNKTQIFLNFTTFDIEDTSAGRCADFVDVRHYGCGAPGTYLCGNWNKYGTRSFNNLMTIIFGTDISITRKGFEAVVSIIFPEDLHYVVEDNGMSYRGKVNFTRNFRPCVHWADVTHCPHHTFASGDIGKQLEENYCRNPGVGTQPWCYYDAYQCLQDTCDVSLLEPCYDKSSQCKDVDCDAEEDAFSICNEKCGCSNKIRTIENPPVGLAYCNKPENISDAIIIDDKIKTTYSIGENVTYKCKTGHEKVVSTCMSDCTWSWVGYVCNSCPTGWFPFQDACYKMFDIYNLKNESRKICEDNKAAITSIKSSEEQTFLEQIRDEITNVWIGIIYDWNLKRHYWEEDGSIVQYTNWKNGVEKGCAYMGNDGRWIGVNCESITFKGVFCKMQPSARKTCGDRRKDCRNVLERRPTACLDYKEFKKYDCALSCNFCSVKNESASRCKNPGIHGNVTMEIGSNEEEINAGEVFVYRCLSNFILVSGNLQRICHVDGTLSGSKPVCLSMYDVEIPVSNQSMVERRRIGARGKAYFGLNVLHTIPKDGILTEWDFYSAFNGLAAFQVWEKSTNRKNYFKLIGMSRVENTGDGRKRKIRLPSNERIPVKAGQYIGVFYSYLNQPGILFDVCNSALNGPFGNQLQSKLSRQWIFGNHGWTVEKEYEFTQVTNYKSCRIYSFNAKIL